MRKIALFTVFAVITSLTSFAQYTISNDKSSITIDGTSNVHDWTENVEMIKGTLGAKIENNKLISIDALTLTVPVKSIKSGKSAMDKNTYKALNEKEYPNISFTLESAKVLVDVIECIGVFKVAGTVKKMKFRTKYSVVNNELIIKGSSSFNMTDFNVDPPTALLGTMTTGDKVTINFNLVFTK